MSSRREEERNEKIIRGLMKLPPNRRCINCNSMGPQYVCINFWTFICTTCSGIHREFTHRVKSVSMAKFTSQEVDSLQNGGNQRARELYLKAWDLQRQRLPDNSNVDKVREFIKKVYVNKVYVMEKSSDGPPRDPQGLSNLEDETRRASSYHSYSQSPPYDFQYEERRYGKHAPALSRKPGSDMGIYQGKLSSFFSPSHSSDHGNDRFANDSSNPRPSDFSVSTGWDPFGSDILSPSSQRDTGSPFRESSRGTLSEVPRNRAVLLSSDSDKRNGVEGMLHSQRTASLGSFGSFDNNSMSFKSVNSTGLSEVSSKPEPFAVISQEKSSSVPPPVQSSTSANFDGLNLFAAPFAPQNDTSVPPTNNNSQLPQTSLTQSVDFFQQYPVSAVSAFTEQQPSQIPQPSLSELFSPLPPQQLTASFHGKISDGIIPDNGGWATFDMAQNFVPLGTKESSSAAMLASDRNNSENFNPFSFDQNSSSSACHEPAVSSNTFWQDNMQNVGNTTKSTSFWNAFENSSEQHPVPDMLKSNEQAFDADTSLGFGAPKFEVFNNDRNLRGPHESETPLPISSSHFNIPLHDYSMVSEVAGLHSVAPVQKPSNPFDLPSDTDMESGNMSQFWDMSSLQSALPNTQNSASYVGDVNQSWFSQNSVPSHVSGGVTFDFPSGSLGLIAGQTPNTHISNIPAQAPPVGGNPFA